MFVAAAGGSVQDRYIPRPAAAWVFVTIAVPVMLVVAFIMWLRQPVSYYYSAGHSDHFSFYTISPTNAHDPKFSSVVFETPRLQVAQDAIALNGQLLSHFRNRTLSVPDMMPDIAEDLNDVQIGDSCDCNERRDLYHNGHGTNLYFEHGRLHRAIIWGTLSLPNGTQITLPAARNGLITAFGSIENVDRRVYMMRWDILFSWDI